jgi:hypothetical protein
VLTFTLRHGRVRHVTATDARVWSASLVRNTVRNKTSAGPDAVPCVGFSLTERSKGPWQIIRPWFGRDKHSKSFNQNSRIVPTAMNPLCVLSMRFCGSQFSWPTDPKRTSQKINDKEKQTFLWERRITEELLVVLLHAWIPVQVAIISLERTEAATAVSM